MKKESITPPEESISSTQLDLFSRFLTNDESSVSNTIEGWEGIPKYFFTKRQVDKLRTEDGLAPSFKWMFEFNGKPCVVRIQPALIEQSDGRDLAFFPSITEELLEEALKKFLTDQRNVIHDPDKSETWVRFSLQMLQKELKSKGKARSLDQIKHGIQVMSRCNITLFVGKKELWSGSILQDLVTVDRDEYLADSKSLHIARLPLFVSHSINNLAYRQFNYERLLRCNEQLSRWIYKQMISKFKQASHLDSYHFMFSKLKTCGLLQQEHERNNRRKVSDSLDELKANDVLSSYQASPIKHGRAIVDVKYTVRASNSFIKEQKAANRRQSDNALTAKRLGIDPCG